MKMMILLHPKDLKDLVIFSLESKFHIELIDPPSEPKAMALLLKSQDLDLILYDCHLKWNEFIELAGEKFSQTPFLLIHSEKKPKYKLPASLKIIEEITKSQLLEFLPVALTGHFSDKIKQVEILSQNQPTEAENHYTRISTALLLRFSPLKADIFIQLSKEKYLKLFLKGDVFDSNDLERYLFKKNIRFLFLLSDQVAQFSIHLTEDLTKILNEESNPPEQLKKAAATGIEAILELRDQLGFSPEIQRLITTTCKILVRNAAVHPQLKDLFIGLLKNEETYSSTHCVYLSQISCAIAAAMKWNSEATFQKLAVASILHDITLINPLMTEIQSLEQLESRKKEFSQIEIKQFKNHPTDAAKISLGITKAWNEVDIIIEQHHELPDGSGFPHGLPALRINPLAAVFIVAHDLVYSQMFNKAGMSIEEFVEKNRQKYSKGNFKGVISALEKIRNN